MLGYHPVMDIDLRYLNEALIDESGTLGVLDWDLLPFQPKRLYWIHSVTPGSIRGNHAHKKLKQFFWLIKGSMSIELSNGAQTQKILMHENKELLVISPGYWRRLFDFSPNTIVVVGADSPYDPTDYIHNWEDFLKWKKETHEN